MSDTAAAGSPTDQTNDQVQGLDGETAQTIQSDLAPADSAPGDAFDDEVVSLGVEDDFDETNGVVSGLEGESDGTAQGDLESTAEQDHEIEPRPVGAQDTFHDDWYGAEDGKDPNP